MEQRKLEKIVDATHIQGMTVGFFRRHFVYLYSCGDCSTYNELETHFRINDPVFACEECHARNRLKGEWRDNQFYSKI
jgi:hypothetical protein